MKFDPIQRSFSAGELTPLLHARSDSPVYVEGLAELSDFMTTDFGPVYKRHGFKHTSDQIKGHVVQFDETYACSIKYYQYDIYTIVDLDSGGDYTWPIGLGLTETEFYEAMFVQDPTGLTVYIVHPNHPVQKLVWTNPSDPSNPASYSHFTPTFTASPWGAGNYPSVGLFRDGRFLLAASDANKNTVWGSKVGSFEDFTTGVNPNDSIVFTLNDPARIKWMADSDSLLLGTSNAEYVITATGGVLIPGDIQAEKQSSYGSILQKPIQAEEEFLFITADQKHIMASRYDDRIGKYTSNDVTYLAEHLAKKKVARIEFQKKPFSLLWALLEDGHLICTPYKKENKVYGYGVHLPSDAVMDDFLSWESNGVSYLGLSYTINGVAGLTYAKLQYDDIEVGYFLDHYVVKTDATPFTTVTGLTHLEGKTVQVLADGATSPDLVVSGGSITLAEPVNEAVVGLAYNSMFKTLPIEQILGSGSTLGWKKRFNKIFVKLLNSAIPKINGSRPPVRDYSTALGEVQPPETGNVEVTNLGIDHEGQITIEQELPYSCIIIGVFGQLTSNKL